MHVVARNTATHREDGRLFPTELRISFSIFHEIRYSCSIFALTINFEVRPDDETVSVTDKSMEVLGSNSGTEKHGMLTTLSSN